MCLTNERNYSQIVFMFNQNLQSAHMPVIIREGEWDSIIIELAPLIQFKLCLFSHRRQSIVLHIWSSEYISVYRSQTAKTPDSFITAQLVAADWNDKEDVETEHN